MAPARRRRQPSTTRGSRPRRRYRRWARPTPVPMRSLRSVRARLSSSVMVGPARRACRAESSIPRDRAGYRAVGRARAAVIAWPEQVTPIASNTSTRRPRDRWRSTRARCRPSMRARPRRACASKRAVCASNLARPTAHALTTMRRMADPRANGPAAAWLATARSWRADMTEAVRHLDAEISVAGALERRPLATTASTS